MIVLQAFLVLRSAPRVKCAVRLVVRARHSLEEDQSGSYVVLVLVVTNNVMGAHIAVLYDIGVTLVRGNWRKSSGLRTFLAPAVDAFPPAASLASRSVP